MKIIDGNQIAKDIIEDLANESEELLSKTVLLLPHMKDVDNLSSDLINTVSVSSISI